MYICKNCGEENGEQERFCTKCGVYIGEPLKGQEILIEETEEQEEKAAQDMKQEGKTEALEKVTKEKRSRSKFNKSINRSEKFVYETLKSIVRPYDAFNKEQKDALLPCIGIGILSSLIFALINVLAASAAFLSSQSYLSTWNKIISFISSKGFMTSEGYLYIFLNSFIIFLLSSIFLFCISYLLIFYGFKKDCNLISLYSHIVNAQNVFILGIAIGSCFYTIAPKLFNLFILLYLIQFILLFKETLEKNFNIGGTKILYIVPILLLLNTLLISLYIEFFVA